MTLLKKETRLEKIKKMSADEMALKIYYNSVNRCTYCINDTVEGCDIVPSRKRCVNGIKDYLESEV